MVFPILRESAGVVEWWSIVKYQIQAVNLKVQVSGVIQVPGFRSQVSGRRNIEAET
jgi:hypothetical protein